MDNNRLRIIYGSYNYLGYFKIIIINIINILYYILNLYKLLGKTV